MFTYHNKQQQRHTHPKEQQHERKKERRRREKRLHTRIVRLYFLPFLRNSTKVNHKALADNSKKRRPKGEEEEKKERKKKLTSVGRHETDPRDWLCYTVSYFSSNTFPPAHVPFFPFFLFFFLRNTRGPRRDYSFLRWACLWSSVGAKLVTRPPATNAVSTLLDHWQQASCQHCRTTGNKRSVSTLPDHRQQTQRQHCRTTGNKRSVNTAARSCCTSPECQQDARGCAKGL